MALQKKDRSDPVAHNFMLVGQILFDLNEKLDELLERTKDLYHPTVAAPDGGKAEIKMASAKDAGTLDTIKPTKPLKMTMTDIENEGIEPL